MAGDWRGATRIPARKLLADLAEERFCVSGAIRRRYRSDDPPTSAAWSVGDFWRDQNQAEFVCTVAGTPETWRQITPITVKADPASGTFPTGYLILNVTDGGLKRHAGGAVVESSGRVEHRREDRLPRRDAHCPAGQGRSSHGHRPRQRDHSRQRAAGGAV